LKRITALILFLICTSILISICSIEPVYEYSNNSHNAGQAEQSKPPDNPSGQPDIDLNPDNLINDGEIMVYKSGSYKTGTDILEGIYVAKNDGSRISKVTIKDSPEPVTEKPEIILTARFLTGSGGFAERDNYINAISKGGGTPVMPQDDTELAQLLRYGAVEYANVLAERYDGLVLTGGGDVAAHFFNQEHHPASGRPDETLDVAELALARAFIEANKPILGICRGMQVINIAMGGELIQDIPDLLGIDLKFHHDEETRHPVKIRTGSWLYDLIGAEAYVTSTHHQAIDGAAQSFTVVAQTGPVIEAMESGNILCVQFHPERMLDEGMLPLFEDFIRRCSYKNIEINYFSTHTIIEIKEGQYIDITGAELIKIEHTQEMGEELFEEYGYYPEGMYQIGFHIPEGEYTINYSNDTDFAHFAIYETTANESLLFAKMLPQESAVITLRKGQFIRLIYANMK